MTDPSKISRHSVSFHATEMIIPQKKPDIQKSAPPTPIPLKPIPCALKNIEESHPLVPLEDEPISNPLEQDLMITEEEEELQPLLDKELKNHSFEGKELESSFFDTENQLLAKEQAKRVDTIKLLINGLKCKRDALKSQIAHLAPTLDSNSKRLSILNNTLVRLENKIRVYQEQQENNNATWASTNAPRFAFANLGKKTAQKEYAPVLVNLRRHTVQNQDGKSISSINRSAAVSDFRHGGISLQELQDYGDLQKLKKQQLDPERAEQLCKLYSLSDAKGIKNSKLDQLLKTIKKNAIESYGADILTSNKSDLDPLKLVEIIQDRTEHLSLLVLQDLSAHFESNPVSKSETVYGRVSLLDMVKHSKNNHGFILYERSQGLDMKAIYDKFDGAVIKFDLDSEKNIAPYIDIEGIIHMPSKFKRGELEQTTLKTVFFNLSVQGHTRNHGLQQSINEEALNKLKSLEQFDQEQIEHLSQTLQKHSKSTSATPFEMAIEVALMFKNSDYLSANCFGGKDRTSYFLALLTKTILQNMIRNKPKKEQEKLIKGWNKELVGKNSIAQGVVMDNAGHTVLKLEEFNLELFNLVNRISLYALCIGLFATGRQLSRSNSKGQLYDS